MAASRSRTTFLAIYDGRIVALDSKQDGFLSVNNLSEDVEHPRSVHLAVFCGLCCANDLLVVLKVPHIEGVHPAGPVWRLAQQHVIKIVTFAQA